MISDDIRDEVPYAKEVRRTAVPPGRATAGCGLRPLEGRQDSPAGRGTSWVLLDAELREGSSHESCLA